MPYAFRTLFSLSISIAKVSAISVGGGLSMIPVFQRELIDRKALVSQTDMTDAIAIAQSLPGIVAVNIAAVLGFRVAKIPGLLAAVIAVAFPPVVVILAVCAIFHPLNDNLHAQAIFLGIRAVVCALIANTAFSIAKNSIRSTLQVIIAIPTFFILVVFPSVNPVFLICAAAAAGAMFARTHNTEATPK